MKMVADKLSPADRMQVLILLKGIQQYLQSADIFANSGQSVYDEPLVVIRNLSMAIEEMNYAKFDEKILCTKKALSASVNQPGKNKTG